MSHSKTLMELTKSIPSLVISSPNKFYLDIIDREIKRQVTLKVEAITKNMSIDNLVKLKQIIKGK